MDTLIPFLIILFIVVIFYLAKKGIKDNEPLTGKLTTALAKDGYTIVDERTTTLWEDYQYHEPKMEVLFIEGL